MQALKWSGIVNIDFIYDENDKQAKILEVNPRYWQSLLGSLFAGVNFPYLVSVSKLVPAFICRGSTHNLQFRIRSLDGCIYLEIRDFRRVISTAVAVRFSRRRKLDSCADRVIHSSTRSRRRR